MKTIPPLNTRVVYRREASEYLSERECRGVVVAHYPSDGIAHLDEESGEKYISAHHVGIKVDAPLPDWWPYVGVDRFAPDIAEIEIE